MTDIELGDLVSAVTASVEKRMLRHLTVMPMLTQEDTARALGVSSERVRQLNDSGEIPFIKMGRLVRIMPSDVNAYLERNYQKNGSKKKGRGSDHE